MLPSLPLSKSSNSISKIHLDVQYHHLIVITSCHFSSNSQMITSTSSQISPPSRAPQAVRLVILTLKTTHVCFLIKSLQWLQRESHWAPHWPSSSTFYLRVSVNAGPSAWKASPSFFTWVTPTFPFMSIITYQ